MMMTSGTGVHYKNWVDCGAQILKNEGVTSFFKGNGANILRGTFFLDFYPRKVGFSSVQLISKPNLSTISKRNPYFQVSPVLVSSLVSIWSKRITLHGEHPHKRSFFHCTV